MAASSSLRNLGRVVRNRALTAVDCRPVLGRLSARGRSRSSVAKSIRTIFEALETRQLMSVIPAPTNIVSDAVRDPGPGNGQLDASSPVIAMDPTDPNRLVAAYTTIGEDAVDGQSQFVRVVYSVNGGTSWSDLGRQGNMFDPSLGTYADPSDTRYALATDVSVAFDRNHNFYLVYSEHSASYSSGAIVLSGWDFSGSEPDGDALAQNMRVYSWQGADAAISPTFVIDNNLPTFTDPTTGNTVDDPTAGFMYVAWTTNLANATDADYRIVNSQFNPNAIYMVMANPANNVTNGPRTEPRFSSPIYVNASENRGGVERNAHPRLVVSQGTDPDTFRTVIPGQVNVVWDDWNSENRSTTPTNSRYDIIKGTTVLVSDGAGATSSTKTFEDNVGGDLDDATTGTPSHAPATTQFDLAVDLTTDSLFQTLQNLTVSIALTHKDLSHVSIDLVAPTGDIIHLVLARTDSGGTSDTDIGITGTTMGRQGRTTLYTTFDDQATRPIDDGSVAAPFIGTFKPEGGEDLGQVFAGLDAATLSGIWSLVITDNRNGPALADADPPNHLYSWKLTFTGADFAAQGDVVITRSRVLGPSNATSPDNYARGTNLSPTGIGAGTVIASDNTLGSFSPTQGLLYIAFTDWGRIQGSSGHISVTGSSNPSDNTDVYLMVSRDGGQTWGSFVNGFFSRGVATRINDDNASKDGFSEANPTGDDNTGRAQFQPAIAVDQATGTVAVTFRDARNDASRDRVATYFAASIDGGETWSQNTYLNTPNAVTDATNLQTVNLGPIPDNLSPGANVRETSLGFGHSQGLALYGGHVVSIWAGNLNGGGREADFHLGILSAVTGITAGPRIVSSTMGQVGLPGDALNPADGDKPKLSYFELEFDRWVDISSFILSGPGQNVHLIYRAPGVSGDANGTEVLLSSIQAVGYTVIDSVAVPTRFRIALATPAEDIGTYSYYVDSTISDRIRKDPSVPITYPQATASYSADLAVPLPIPSVGTGGTATSDDLQSNVITVSGFPDVQAITSMTVRLRLDHTANSDLMIKLVSPTGTEVVLVGSGSAFDRNFGTGTGTSIIYTVFDDFGAGTLADGFGPYTDGSVVPDNLLSAFAGESLNGDWTLVIEDTSGATPPDGDAGVLYNWGIDFNTAIVAPDSGNFLDQDADGIPGERAIAGNNPTATIGDMYATPKPTLATAWDGTNFHTPYTTDTLPLIIAGPHVVTGRTYAMQGPAVPIVDASAPPVVAVLTPGVTESTIQIGGDTTARVSKVVVTVNITHASAQSLTLTLVAPDGTEVLLVQNRPGSSTFIDLPDFFGTVFDDSATTPISFTYPPFYGSFQPEQPLSALVGKALAGDWKLRITDNVPGHNGLTPELVNWSITANSTPVAQDGGTDNIHVTFDRDMDPTSLDGSSVVRVVGPNGEIAGPFTVEPDPSFDPFNPDPDPTHARTYKIKFAKQTVSGSYSIVLASTIRSADGDLIDANMNAGVDALRGYAAFTVPMNYSTLTSVPITADSGGAAVSTSTIDITDAYTIQGVTVRVNATFPNDSLLTGYLVSPSGTRIKLFDRVGGTHANFTNTLFDDYASTPIVNGLGSFFGRFAPQESLTTLVGSENAQGTWTLEITNHSTTGVTGAITGWSLSFAKPQAGTGLGDAVADRTTIPFKIFNLGLNTPGSTSSWTSVTTGGTVPNGSGANTTAVGRITSVAIDPSDPSGNTAFITTPSGGIWKTTNFMTTSPSGPTYAPLTDFGPVGGMHVASVALIPRNNDPNQTIVFAMTGDPDMAQAGVGLLRSMDGGMTWTLLDSKTNFDPVTGLQIPNAQRAHDFIGTVGYKVIADPTPTPTGEYILYAALSGNGTTGGVYRSTDTGRTWTQVLAGDATDVIVDTNSGPKDAFGNATGNLQILYAGIAGQGIFITANRGQSWTKLTPLGFDGSVRETGTNPPGIKVEAGNIVDPNDNQGRIVLAMPNPTGSNAIADAYHEGWVYAAVVTTAANGNTRSGDVDGLYMTKDFGQNWTRVDLNRLDNRDVYGFVPTNSQGSNTADFTPSSGPNASEGNYALSLAVDPLDPNVVYFGGSGWGTQYGSSIIRVDTTGISDAHAFYMRNDTDDNVFRADGANTDTVTLKNWYSQANTDIAGQNPIDTPFINLINNPGTGIVPGSTYRMGNVATVTNSGRGSKWVGLDELLNLPLVNGIQVPVHNVITTVDPITGKTRITVSTDSGVYTTVYHGNGQASTGIGNAVTPTGGRSGDLAANEMLYGAVQPSVGTGLANEIAGALFYAMGKTTGLSWSDPNILTNGNTSQTYEQAPSGGTGVATDQTGSGTVYDTLDPYRGNAFTNFFLVNGVAQTTGLFLENNSGDHTQDGQWPDYFAPNFAVNPINGDQIVVSSATGRIYATTNRGLTWFVIGEPDQTRLPAGATAVLDGTYAPALAFGSPDPSATNLGNDATNLRVYVGTTGGHVYVTLDGGGIAANGWRDISAGLDGSAVQSIVTDPTRGSHALYAVTKAGIYFMADSTAANPTWVRINGNIASLTRNPFNDPDLAENALSPTGLTSLVADWRYVLPGPNGTAVPVLYVGGQAGVFRSLDNGTTWTLFPTASDGADLEGGYLPSVTVTDLDLGIGNVDPTTGFTTVSTGPSILLATTDGRGQFAIRVAPVLVGTTSFGPDDSLGQRTVTGLSQVSAYGNQVTINIYNGATPDPSQLIGTGTTDSNGKFVVSLTSPISGTSIIVQAVDGAGVAGPVATVLVPPVAPAAPTLDAATNSGSTGDTLTNFRKPKVNGTAAVGNTVTIYVDGNSVGTVPVSAGGTWSYTLLNNLADGLHSITVTQTDAQSQTSIPSGALQVTVDGTGPSGAGVAVPATTSNIPLTGVTVATFTDAHQIVSATIDWGDGSPATVVTNGSPADGATFNVVSSHTYTTAGNYTITVTAKDNADNVSGAVTTSAAVSVPVYTFVLAGQTPAGLEENTPFANVPIAVITDGKTSPAHTAADLTATVNWGDGTTSIITGTASADGQIVAAPGGFKVLGSHTYIDNRQDQSAYVVNVTVTTTDGKTAQVGSVLNVVDVAPTASLTQPANIYVGQAASLTVSASDQSPADRAAGFSYLVDWGDGTTETIARSANNGSGVGLTHTFTTAGTRTITVTATDKDGKSKTVTQSLTVKNPPALNGSAVNGDASQITFNVSDTDLAGGVNLSNIKLYYNGDGVNAIPLDGAVLTFDPASGAGTFDLSNLATPLRDGDYQLQITVNGTLLPFISFFKLQGDVNGDGIVEAKDLAIINKNLGKSATDPGANAAADLNRDGAINAADANLYNKLKGHKASTGKATLTLKTGKPGPIPKIDFGKVAVNTNAGYIDLVIKNVNPNLAPLNIGKLSMAGAGFNFALPNVAWGPATANAVTTINPGKSMTVRIYLKPSAKTQNLAGKLKFAFATSTSRDYKDVTVPVKATIVSASAAVNAKATKAEKAAAAKAAKAAKVAAAKAAKAEKAAARKAAKAKKAALAKAAKAQKKAALKAAKALKAQH